MPDIWDWVFVFLGFGVGTETRGPSQGRIALGLCRKTIGDRGTKSNVFLGSDCEGAHATYDTENMGRFALVTSRWIEGIDDLIDDPGL